MGSPKNSSWLILQYGFWLTLALGTYSGVSAVSVKLLKTPHAFSNRNSATFTFEPLEGGNGKTFCKDCISRCKLDNHIASDCGGRKVIYTRLQDGYHTFEVCTNGSAGVGCASYNWTVDTIPPTAYVTAETSFTNASNVSVNISFSEPCGGGGGFVCSSVNSCNLHVYGPGGVVQGSLKVVQPNIKYSLLVSLSSSAQYGRIILALARNICTDSAGNKFTRTENSTLVIHFDRRDVLVDLRTHIPEKLLQLGSQTRTVLATNKSKHLKVYLYFNEPVLNSSAEILKSLSASKGSLIPIQGSSFTNRRFGFQIENLSEMAIVTVNLDSSLVISRQGTPATSVPPITFLYDSQRPGVRLTTKSNKRTREKYISTIIKFTKPVFDFNSSLISISGGHLHSFHEASRNVYRVQVEADSEVISISVPENVTADVAGNGNLASNLLTVWHYSVPRLSLVLSAIVSAVFAMTAFASGLLTVSTASLQSVGAFSTRASFLTTDPVRNLFRAAGHLQFFALTRWLPVSLPIDYYELARGLQWIIPYLSLPWETDQMQLLMVGSNSPMNPHPYSLEVHDSGMSEGIQPPQVESLKPSAVVYGSPLTSTEYQTFFESQNLKPEAERIWESQDSNGWRDFDRSMFWLAVICGSLILVHALLLLIMKLRRGSGKQRSYGALIFPRIEILLVVLGLPCICKASAALVKGGASSGLIVGILLLSVVSFLLLALFLFLSIGITCGKLLQYKEVHQEGQKFHWYQELVRVTLGPGKKGQWTWKSERASAYLTIFGPLFEDLRGPPKYMLTQIVGGNLSKRSDSIIASDDENEDAEAPFIQKLFGILRIYYTLLESVKRVSLGVVAGIFRENWSSKPPIIALLCITSFQLFFMVLKKPFIKKKVQLVEIISVSCEVGIFATCIVLLEKAHPAGHETRIGAFMVSLFLLTFIVQMVNEWNALYIQTKQLDTANNSFLSGLKIASIGFILLFIPQRWITKLDSKLPRPDRTSGETGDSTSGDKTQSSESRSSGERPWLRQLRELAKASFTKEGGGSSNDPSTSQTRWSGLWGKKRSGSSSMTSSGDFKARPKSLYKDLEAIFASK